MSVKWTKHQKQAIDARRGSVLVTAAAGSGKTAVLTRRVIERLIDPTSPTSADRLLIVTFTRAAAFEMRTRIATALEEQIKKDPTNTHLVNQQMLLPSAKICTIDAFCSSLVREHFEQLEISPDIEIADEGELSMLSQKAMTLTLEELYQNGEKGFLDLVEQLIRGRDDSYLSDVILEMYKQSVSYPFPKRWLSQITADYKNALAPEKSVFGEMIFAYAEEAVRYCHFVLRSIKKVVFSEEEKTLAFGEAISSDQHNMELLEKAIKKRDWNKSRMYAVNFDFVRRGTLPKEMRKDADVVMLDDGRNRVKDVVRKHIAPLFCSTAEQYAEDMRLLSPTVSSLCRAVELYSRNFAELKSEKNLADFNDITHHALSLLVRETEDGYERTELARELSSLFDEILIDEYQDTNKAQDMLFCSISNNNLFRVGDVKQSIYRFRQAMPEIFIDLKNTLSLYDLEKDNYPSKIALKNNFRSRKSIVDCVNFVFSQVMSAKTGGVSYDSEEELVFSAPYGEKEDESVELHVLDTGELDTEEETSVEYQAKYTAGVIEDLVKSGFTVKGEDGNERPVMYKDICILLRSLSAGRGETYAAALKERKIPCFTQLETDFFSAPEVSLVLNLLRVIDNPKQDIALLSVLLSPLFGFSADECAALRVNCRDGNIYSCLLAARESGNEKATAFLERIEKMRLVAVCSRVSDFIRLVYDETGIDSVVRSRKGSSAKKENLMLLLDYADIYEKAGYHSLPGFVRFVDRLDRSSGDLPGAVGVSAGANVVRIMTIHKSKGLEFPVCILSGCSSIFNRRDETGNAVISSKGGLGLMRRDEKTFAQYPTICHCAVKNSLHIDTVSEEMRVLYVAMTRAKEKLIMISAFKNVEKAMLKYASDIVPELKTITPFSASLASRYSDWLFTALLRHPDLEPLREAAGLGYDLVLPADFRIKLTVERGHCAPQELPKEEKVGAEASPLLLKELEERFSWKYEYEPFSYVLSKRAASEVDKNFVDREYFAASRPSFLSRGLSAAQRGIAVHSFMQYADYENAKRDLEGEIHAVFSRGLITERERDEIDRRQLSAFFESELCSRILKSSLVMREKKFTISVPVGEIYPELSHFNEERVMIQGIADCAFLEDGELVVLDYKTDRLESEEAFADKYSNQVKTYKKALELCTGYKVRQTLLYSFRLSKEIEIESEKNS